MILLNRRNMFQHARGFIRAPEFPAGLSWLNHPPLSLKQLQGKAVLLVMWTYSSPNCLRMLPHVQRWHEQYEALGLRVIGIHAPEFDFEKIPQQAAQAMKMLGVNYPVVLDPDYKIWNAYSNRWWPRILLIDSHGMIVYDHVGEGGYAETEMEIQALLASQGQRNFPAIVPDLSPAGEVFYPLTPQLFLGFVRGRFGNAGHFSPGEEHAFTDPQLHEEGLLYLHGHFTITNESITHTRSLSAATEYLTMMYRGFSVQMVAGGKNHKEAVVEVELNGKPLPSDFCGKDVVEEKGKTVAHVDFPRLYDLISARTHHRGLLTLKTASSAFECFSLIFGGA
jgi:thiol-disulfide isomerase/thioredoxin